MRFEREIFVYGSNLSGRNGKGAALAAVREHDAPRNLKEGWGGRAYAIPTKGLASDGLPTLQLATIDRAIDRFISFAEQHPTWRFNVTQIGCGLAGYRPEDIAPLFVGTQDQPNIYLPQPFVKYLRRWPPERISFDAHDRPVK